MFEEFGIGSKNKKEICRQQKIYGEVKVI